MTPDEVVYSTLLTSGLKGTKNAWPLGKAPALPWFTYKRARGGEVFADNRNYALMQRYEIGLYQHDADEDVRSAFEEALDHLGPHAANEVWNPVENCWITTYSLTYQPDD